jgi:hypothetical protein
MYSHLIAPQHLLSCFLRFSRMKWNLSVAWGLAALISCVDAKNETIADRQPTVSAPHGNLWKVLSEEEAASVNALLQEKMSLTGDFGDSQDSYV